METRSPADAEIIREQLGIRYERCLVPLERLRGKAARSDDGKIYSVQQMPALPFDDAAGDTVSAVLVDLEPHEELVLSECESPSRLQTCIRITRGAAHITIRNAGLALRLPADGVWDPPVPGPWAGMRIGDGAWFGRSELAHCPLPARVETTIDATGPCGVQWTTVYRWGGDQRIVIRARWAAGADTILVVEEIAEDSDAAIEWRPFGNAPARGYHLGGGERPPPMEPLRHPHSDEVRQGRGPRRLACLSHIGYFNQWNDAWVGFADDKDRFAGIFSCRGGLWRRRGMMRAEVWDDDRRGQFVRFPIKRGLRLYGLVLATRRASGLDAQEGRCLLNRRKVQLSDAPLSKVRRWVLDGPPEPRKPRLVATDDLETFRARLAADPAVTEALARFSSARPDEHPAYAHACALWRNNEAALRRTVNDLDRQSAVWMKVLATGGYEGVLIFHGRDLKRRACDLDTLWALGLMNEADYRRIRGRFLALAYVFADPDYCRYGDFWPHEEPAEGIAEALKDEMGDCPVPPNFASEFFSTTGVAAELFPSHPMHAEWRQWSLRMTDLFLEHLFEEDGTYHESVNYHTHAFSELCVLFYPWHVNGARDYFHDHQRVRGSLDHFIALQMPPLEEGAPQPIDPAAWAESNKHAGIFADWQQARRCPLPANGNSGGHGLEQEWKGELTVAAAALKKSDPALAGRLMTAWRRAGKPVLDNEHPTLTLLTLDPSLSDAPIPWESRRRLGLGVVSRAMRDDVPVWCLFRAGKATHHMCFDQGHLHLAAYGHVMLGDTGYHCEGLPPVATWSHSTITYGEHERWSSGYTGVERAPEPALVHLDPAFDWCVHRIVNTNYRVPGLPYWVQIPCPVTRHVRHYLFVKPDLFLLWDVFEEAHGPSVFWLHPKERPVRMDDGCFYAGRPEAPGLQFRFLRPEELDIVDDEQRGPLWSLGIRNGTGRPYLTLLAPRPRYTPIKADFNEDQRLVAIESEEAAVEIRLPEPGSATALPEINAADYPQSRVSFAGATADAPSMDSVRKLPRSQDRAALEPF